MKTLLRFFALLLLPAACAFAQCGPTTANLGLNLPAHGTNNWDTCLNNNANTIDNYLSGASILPPFKAAGLTLSGTGLAANNGAFSGTLSVTGTATFSGNFVLGGNASVTGNLIVLGTTAFSSGLTGTTGAFSGNVTSPSILTGGDCGTSTTCSNTSLPKPYIVTGKITVSSNNATISGISPAFGNTSARCWCADNTTAANGCNANLNSVSTIGITAGGSSDNVSYGCAGTQ